MGNKPLVSIVITSYNRALWIREAIESALKQDYENLEIIISDNASTDNSDEVIRSYCHDRRIKYSRNEVNIGMFANFSKAFFQIAKGDYISHISSDDYFIDSSFVSEAIKIIQEEENVVLVFGKYLELYMKNNLVKSNRIANYYKVRFRLGEEVLLDFKKNDYLHWGGCLLSRKCLLDKNIKILDVIGLDKVISFEMMTYGNVGFVDVDAYMVRFHDQNFSKTQLYSEDILERTFDRIEKIYKEDNLNKKVNSVKRNKWYNYKIKKDIKTYLISSLMSKDQAKYDIVKQFLIKNYQKEYQVIIKKDFKYLIAKNIVLPIANNKLLSKIASKLFPSKSFFSN